MSSRLGDKSVTSLGIALAATVAYMNFYKEEAKKGKRDD